MFTLLLSGEPFWDNYLIVLSRLNNLFYQVVDRNGYPIGKVYNPKLLCQYLSRFPKGLDACKNYCQKIPIEAFEKEEIIFFTCWMGLSCFAIPIFFDEKEIAVLLGGKVLTKIPYRENYAQIAKEYKLDFQELLNGIGELEFIKDENLKASSDLIFHFGNGLIRTSSKVDRLDYELKISHDLTKKLVKIYKLDDLLKIVLDELANVVDAERASIGLFDRSLNKLILKAAKGIEEEVFKEIKYLEEGSLSYEVMTSGEAVLVKNINQDIRFSNRLKPGYKTPSFISLPIKGNGTTIGVLNIADKASGEIFDEADINILHKLIPQTFIVIERALHRKDLEEYESVYSGGLVNMYNRRYFQEYSINEIFRCKRYERPFSIILLNIENFDQYKRIYGETAGEEILKSITSEIRYQTRLCDIVAKLNQDQFICALSETPKAGTLIFTEKMLKRLKALLSVIENTQMDKGLALKAGIATYPEDGSSYYDILNYAEENLRD